VPIRALIFDLYGTLLELGPPPRHAAARWAGLWRDELGRSPRLSLRKFAAACRLAVAAEHAAARAQGIAFPEVFWPAIADAVLPEFARIPAGRRYRLPSHDGSLIHTVRLMPGAAAALRTARRASRCLGLASNCQPYTLDELDDALARAGLRRTLFDPELCFFSFAHGFSKPDPHVFRLLAARLRVRGIGPGEILMVGDRADNDLDPARRLGWQTCAIGPDPVASWARFRELLRPD